MKFATVVLFLLSFVSCSTSQIQFSKPAVKYATSAIKNMEDNVHHLEFYDSLGDEDARCSSTAIGPNAVLTASHCETPNDDIKVDGKSATIVKTIRDKKDHTILILDGATFSTYGKIVERQLAIGENLTWVGYPGDWAATLRKGYVAQYNTEDDVYFVDARLFSGDSGSGVYDSEGNLVGVVSVAASPRKGSLLECAGLFSMNFKSEQMQEALIPVTQHPREKQSNSFFMIPIK